MESHYLYRLRDADEALLYIGITNNLGARLRQHEATKPWFGDVRRIEVDLHATRADVAEAERRAVREETPRYNVIRFRGPTKLRTLRVDNDLWEAVKEAAAMNGETATSVILAGLQEYIDGGSNE